MSLYPGMGIVPPLMNRRVLPIFLLLAVLGAAGRAVGQGIEEFDSPPPSILDQFDGRPIRELRIQRRDEKTGEISPLAPADEQLVRNQIRAVPPGPFRRRIATDDLKRLNRLGQFGRFEYHVLPQPDSSLILIYTIEPRPVVRDVQSVGNRRLSDEKVIEASGVQPGLTVDRFELDRGARRIEDLYRKEGYYLAEVSVDAPILAETGIVVYNVREGGRVRVMDIRFEGNASFSPGELRSAIKTTEAGIFEIGPLDDDVLAGDVLSVAAFYRDRGYLDAAASRLVRLSPNGKEAIVTFVVNEGPRYTLRNIRVIYPDRARSFGSPGEARAAAGPGDAVFVESPTRALVYSYGVYSPGQVAGLIPIKPGDVLSSTGLRRSVELLQRQLGEMGFVDARVDVREVRDTSRPEVDVLFEISEGRRSWTGEVVIAGNVITLDGVIRLMMRVRPDRPLSTPALEESRQKIEQSNLFLGGSVKVTPQPENPAMPGYRDVFVEVTETNTGLFELGGAVGSDNGVTGRLAYTQRNFNIRDYPDSLGELLSGQAFHGAGQTAGIEIAPGNEVQTYTLSFTEPNILYSEYSASARGRYYSRFYSQYDEIRYGGSLNVGRSFGSRWNGGLSLSLDWVDLTDIDASAPVDYFAVNDARLVDTVGFSLARTTIDSRLRPTKGTRFEIGVGQVGLLGNDYSFTRFATEFTAIFTVDEDFLGRKTILAIDTRAGYIPQGSGEVPFYERFYQGGRTFRGFGVRGVSPRGIRNDNGLPGLDPVGGTWNFFLGAEITQPIYDETLSLVGFIDSGTVTNDPGFDDYRVSIGTGIRVYAPALSPVPLAFDFGFPILKEDGDRERIFSFFLELPY